MDKELNSQHITCNCENDQCLHSKNEGIDVSNECGCHHHSHEFYEESCNCHSVNSNDLESCCCGHHHVHEHDDECCQECNHHHSCCCGHEHEHFDNEDHHHGLTVNFDGVVQADINRVWEVLTQNGYISQWSDGIEISDYRPGGILTYQDEEMMLLDIEPPVLLTFTWVDGTIAIELSAQSEKETLINFSHWIENISEETAINLSYWMINLQSIAALSEGKVLEDRASHFAEILPKMREMLSLETRDELEF